MVEPIRIEYDVGEDVYGRRVRLVREKVQGRLTWSIRREASNQLDDPANVDGLTDGCIEKMHDAMRSAK